MKNLMAKFLVVCLIISILPVSAFAYKVPDYAVTLNASAPKIYEGEKVDIYFNINYEDFLMTDMSVGYDTEYFVYEASEDGIDDATNGVVEFKVPEIKGVGSVNSEKGGYDLATKFTFKANEVADTVEVPFTIESADIVYSYESAREDYPTNVDDKEGTSVIIVKQYDVSFVDEDGSTLIGEVKKVDKGLGDKADTQFTAPAVDYEDYVKDGLVADYYEHVWTYNGKEYTDEEILTFGQGSGYPEITEDTTFVLDVREQTFDVNVPADKFDTTATPDKATYGTDYKGKIKPYDDKYDYTVIYEFDIDGDGKADDTKEVLCVGDSFTIPGENIIGDMTLTIEKELNIVIKAYADYVTGYFLITVDGAADGYTFDGHEMYKSENHNNLRAWLYNSEVAPGESMSTEEAEAVAETLIFTSTTGSDIAYAGYDVNESGTTDISDAAITHGAYTVELSPVNDWVKEYLSADVNKSFKVDTDDYNEVVDEYKGRN